MLRNFLPGTVSIGRRLFGMTPSGVGRLHLSFKPSDAGLYFSTASSSQTSAVVSSNPSTSLANYSATSAKSSSPSDAYLPQTTMTIRKPTFSERLKRKGNNFMSRLNAFVWGAAISLGFGYYQLSYDLEKATSQIDASLDSLRTEAAKSKN